MPCNHAKNCELFTQFTMSPTLELWKMNYCESQNFSNCARYKMSLSGQPISLTLLPSGGNLSVTDNSGIGTSCLFSAITNHQTNLIKPLLRAGIDPNIKNKEGMTPLMAAAECGSMDITEILINYGADIYCINNMNETAIDIAIKHNHLRIAKLMSSDENLGADHHLQY